MKKNKHLIIAVCVLLCVMLLTACGGGDGKATASATPAPTGAAEASATGGTNSGSLLPPRGDNLQNAIKAGETYRYFCWAVKDENDPYSFEPTVVQENLPKKRAELEEQYGITIKYIINDAQDWAAKVMEASLAGTPITDILHGGGPFAMLNIYNFSSTGGRLLLQLDEYSDYADFSDPSWWRTELQQSGYFNGHQYFAVPNVIGIEHVALNQVCIFNKSLLESAGYPADKLYEMNQSGEWTWDKFYEVAISCTNPDTGTIGVNVGDSFSLIHSLFSSAGARAVTSETKDGATEVTFTPNTPEALEAWDFFIKLGQAGAVDYRHASGDVEIFLSGNVGMICTYFNRVINIASSKRHPEYGILFPPKQEVEDEYTSDVNWFTPYAAMSQISNPAGAVQLLSLYCAPLYSAEDERNQASVEAELMQYIPDEGSLYTMNNIADKTVDNSLAYVIYSSVSIMMSDGTASKIDALLCNYKEEFVSGAKTPAVFYASVKSGVDQALKDALASAE